MHRTKPRVSILLCFLFLKTNRCQQGFISIMKLERYTLQYKGMNNLFGNLHHTVDRDNLYSQYRYDSCTGLTMDCSELQ